MDPDCGCVEDAEHLSIRAGVDDSTWDGPAAMSNCASAKAPASCYSAICAGRRDGDPAQQSTWALPHHKTPGAAPNAAGVRNGLARLGGTQGLQNKAAAQAHLEAHMRAIQAASSADDEKETRYFESVTFDLRAMEEAGAPVLIGHAAVFNQLSEKLGPGFRERIKPGAFTAALRGGGTYGLWNHNADFPLASSDSGTLRLKQDDEGLQFRMELDPDVSYASDVLKNVRSGRVTKMSFGFTTDTDDWHTEDGETVRDLIKVRRLWDVSPVVFPAYPQASVSARSRLIAEHWHDFEEHTHDERSFLADLELRDRHLAGI